MTVLLPCIPAPCLYTLYRHHLFNTRSLQCTPSNPDFQIRKELHKVPILMANTRAGVCVTLAWLPNQLRGPWLTLLSARGSCVSPGPTTPEATRSL